eukprot:gene1930-33340_t
MVNHYHVYKMTCQDGKTRHADLGVDPNDRFVDSMLLPGNAEKPRLYRFYNDVAKCDVTNVELRDIHLLLIQTEFLPGTQMMRYSEL